MFGPPLEIVTDNGPQYVGQPYEDIILYRKLNIKHTTTSPRYPQSNGLIERQVRTVKGIIQKCAKTGNDTLIALQQHRCTPLDSNLSSPSEIIFNRPIRTTLPSHHPTLMQQNQQLINEQLLQRRDRMIRDPDRRAGPDRAPSVACWTAREDPQQRDPPVEPGWRIFFPEEFRPSHYLVW